MNNQLATKEAILNLVQMSKSAATLQALAKHLATDRVLVEGSTQRSGITFARVGDTVIRVSSEVEKSPMVFDWAQNVVTYAPERVSVNIAPVTLGELLDCQRELEKNGTVRRGLRLPSLSLTCARNNRNLNRCKLKLSIPRRSARPRKF